MDTSLGEHGVVLNLGLAKRGAVVADDDKLGCNTERQCQQHCVCRICRAIHEVLQFAGGMSCCEPEVIGSAHLTRDRKPQTMWHRSTQDVWAVAKPLTLPATQRLEASLVAQGVLATLHDKLKPGVDALLSLLLLGTGWRM